MSIDDHDDQCESEYMAGGFTDCGCVARIGVGVTKLGSTAGDERPRCHCDEPKGESTEGRFCASCQDYEGTCINDHCDTCGAST